RPRLPVGLPGLPPYVKKPHLAMQFGSLPMSSSINDQILADRQQTWNGFCRLLLWGTIGVAAVTLFALYFII
ncbi:MAG TPA: hypothetical protein VM659_23070, partial [Dongiaceae bacterium]|nr:hypothetical protein [Dongiaceae bacterium]